MERYSTLSEEINIEISDAIYIENKVWFVANNFNSLFCMDIKSKTIELVGIFPRESYSQEGLFLSMILIKHKIYFIPFLAKHIAIYDIQKNIFDCIEIDKNKMKKGEKKGYFVGARRYNNYLFLIPAFPDVIIRLDTDTYEQQYITEWAEKVKKDILFEKDIYFGRQSIIKNDKLYAPFTNANAVLEIDCNTLECIVYKLGNEIKGYSGICDDGENFWLSGRRYGELAKWNLRTKEKKVFTMNHMLTDNNVRNCLGVIYYDNKVRVFPIQKDDSTFFELQEKVVLMLGKFQFVKEADDYLLYYENGVFTIINKITGEEFKIPVTINRNIIDIKKICSENRARKENKDINLNNILIGLEENKLCSLEIQSKGNGIGKTIYNSLK